MARLIHTGKRLFRALISGSIRHSISANELSSCKEAGTVSQHVIGALAHEGCELPNTAGSTSTVTLWSEGALADWVEALRGGPRGAMEGVKRQRQGKNKLSRLQS